jgi:hypothetical protein
VRAVSFVVCLAGLGGCDRLLNLSVVEHPDGGTIPGLRNRAITITPSTDEALVDFPLSIVLDGDEDLSLYARADGLDIGFSAADGAPLSFELVRYAAGSLEAWVKVTLAGTTQLTMSYGGGLVSSVPEDAWSNAMIAAWHLDASATGRDSTRRGLDLMSSTIAPMTVAGMIGDGLAFTDSATAADRTRLCGRTGDLIALGTSAFSYSVWLNAGTQTSTFDQPFHTGGNTNGYTGFCFELEPSNFSAQLADDGTTYEQVNFVGAPRNRWVHLAAVYTPPGTLRLFLDGVQNNVRMTLGLGAITTDAPMCLGGDLGYTGLLDEPRIYSVPLSAAWIDAEYENVVNRTDFVRIAPPE